jgi:hypothetical protein
LPKDPLGTTPLELVGYSIYPPYTIYFHVVFSFIFILVWHLFTADERTLAPFMTRLKVREVIADKTLRLEEKKVAVMKIYDEYYRELYSKEAKRAGLSARPLQLTSSGVKPRVLKRKTVIPKK